uniref:Uncharacterized protein n=1 Tax=Nelumbo nucifera TaxID=4432 RepID=A0A822ZQT4_NELNU|nr:TPA_asm: hypothetical protein HUJ06_004015 [Nelumbo nucifera]
MHCSRIAVHSPLQKIAIDLSIKALRLPPHNKNRFIEIQKGFPYYLFEKDNGIVGSRYMSPSTSTSYISSSSSRRCPPPLVSRPTTSTTASTPLSSLIKWSQTAETSNAAEVSVASKMLFTSTWSLSVSFHGESFSLPINKMKVAPMPNLSSTRKATPERRRTMPLRGKIDDPGGID